MAPRWLAVPALVAAATILVPLVALVIRAPWGSLGTILGADETMAALRLSAVTVAVTTVLSLVLGVPLGVLLGRSHSRLVGALRPVAVLPVVLPPVAGGVALTLAYGRTGVVGGPLDDLFGVTVPFTTAAVVLAQLLVALPFTVVTVEAAARDLDVRYEEAARTLGASPSQSFWLVTVPGLRSAIVAGGALSFARALGELGATLIFAGSLQGTTRTLPLEVLLQLDAADPATAAVLSLVLLVASAVVLVALRGRWTPAVTRSTT